MSVGLCSKTSWLESRISLDGMRYSCGGKILLKNGITLRASLQLQTHTFGFLERAYCYLDEIWYSLDEPELLRKLGISSSDDAFPFKWSTDIPIDFSNVGSYQMKATRDNDGNSFPFNLKTSGVMVLVGPDMERPLNSFRIPADVGRYLHESNK